MTVDHTAPHGNTLSGGPLTSFFLLRAATDASTPTRNASSGQCIVSEFNGGPPIEGPTHLRAATRGGRMTQPAGEQSRRHRLSRVNDFLTYLMLPRDTTILDRPGRTKSE